MECNKCPELSETRKKIVWGEYDPIGDVNADVLAIAEAPGPDENWRGRPMMGTSGNEARQHLTINGITMLGVYITNVLKCHPPGNRDPKSNEIKNCLPHLEAEIKAVNPRYIITMGRFATRTLLGEVDMEMVHGIPFQWGKGRVVIPTYHPAAGLHDPNLMIMFHADMKIAGAICRGKILPLHTKDKWKGKEDYQLVTSSSEVMAWVEGDIIAIDTEWAKGKPWCLSLSTRAGEAAVIPHDAHKALRRVKEILEGDVTTIIHNALYDLPVLEQMGIRPRRVADTMVMAYLLQNEPQALKVLAYRHCGVEMSTYDEMVGPATWGKAMVYLNRVMEREWPDPEPVLEWPKGEPHVRQPQNIKRKVGQLLSAIDGGDTRKHPYTNWKGMDDTDQVESVLGMLEKADLSDIKIDDAVRYSARDADATIRVYPLLWERIKGMGLEDVFWRDIKMMPMPVDMMDNGMLVDKDQFAKLSLYFGNRMDEVGRDIANMVGYPINPISHQQCQALLYDDLKLDRKIGKVKAKSGTKKSTAIDVIKRMEHPVIDPIIDYRQYHKMKTSYADVIPKLAGEDGRVRTTLRITRTATGRLSSSDPNLMAQPVRTEEGRMVRDGYVAPPGWSLVSTDYTQVEMKVAAFHSGDEVMCGIFNGGEDIHLKTAAAMFGIPEGSVDEMEHRYPAKRVGFGILNLITAKGLHRELIVGGVGNWTISDCNDMIKTWFDMYKGVASYMKKNGEEAKRYGYVRDMWGRIRYIPGIRSQNRWIMFEAERQAGNAPIQMGAQGIIKQAMGELVPVYRELVKEGHGVKSLLQIHDDLVWEIEDKSLGLVIPVIRDVMERATPPNLPFPLEVDVKVGKRWGSTSKW